LPEAHLSSRAPRPLVIPSDTPGEALLWGFDGTLGRLDGPPDVLTRWWAAAIGSTVLRRGLLLLALGLVWELYARWLNNPLLVPTLQDTLIALTQGFASGVLVDRTLNSLGVLGVGYLAGVAAAALLCFLAISTRIGSDLLTMLAAMFNPLPAIALLPLALLWFGLGPKSLVFVLVHSVLWPLALNAYSGLRGVSRTLRMVGASFGLRGVRFALQILVPAALPSILAGLRIGWAFAWRTLIAAEFVFGVSSGSGGLGWFIFENRNQLDIADVFAGLLTVILIGLAVEGLLFRTLERWTVERWGMQR
jgi:NitT/TauT family transport system permease protein